MHQIVSPRAAAGASAALRVVAELEQARRDDRVAREMSGAGEAPARHRLEVHERLHRRAVPPAELGWVRRDHPAVVEQRGLPRTEPLRNDLVARVLAHEVGAASARPVCGRRGRPRARRGTRRLRGRRRASSVEPDVHVRDRLPDQADGVGPRARHALDAVDEVALQHLRRARDLEIRQPAESSSNTTVISRRARFAPRQ